MSDITVACACAPSTTGGRTRWRSIPRSSARCSTRLRRIEGQVRGLQKMVEEERYCAEVLTQVSSVHEALRGVGRAMLHNHLRTAPPRRSGRATGTVPRRCTTS